MFSRVRLARRRATVSGPMNPHIKEARLTLALAFPIIIGQVSQMLMGVTDTVMIGRLGTVPLAASAFAGGVFSVFFVIGIGLLLPVAVFASREHGAGDDAAGGVWLKHGVMLSVLASVAGIALMLGLSAGFDRMGQPPEVVAAVEPYYTLIVVSLLPALVFQVFRQFAEALGRPWVPMLIMLAGVALNVVLNWILIYGNLGAPALGLSMAVGMRVGKAVGEGRTEALRSIAFGALVMSCAIMSVSAAGFAAGGTLLARGFVSDPATVELAARLLVVAAIFQLFDGAQVIGSGALRGLTDVRVPAGITFIAYWVLAIPGGYALGLHTSLGAVGIWAGLATGLAIAAVLLALRFLFLTKEKTKFVTY